MGNAGKWVFGAYHIHNNAIVGAIINRP